MNVWSGTCRMSLGASAPGGVVVGNTARVTSELLWRATFIAALIDAPLVIQALSLSAGAPPNYSAVVWIGLPISGLCVTIGPPNSTVQKRAVNGEFP